MNQALSRTRSYIRLLLIAGAAVAIAVLFGLGEGGRAPAVAENTDLDKTVFLPLIFRSYPWQSPFGTEVEGKMDGVLIDRAQELNGDWIRRNVVSWRAIQPNEGDAYNWSVLAQLEDELHAYRKAGLTPILVVQHSPRWATIGATDCGAVRADRFGAFASFMGALVERYSAPEFNVHYWEMGNEPDVDPSLVPVDSQFGCWGDIDDAYYGGEYYGEMLKVVTPAIRAADPSAQVLVGGLLLASPDTQNPDYGKPELFLKGMLRAGAAPYFDIVPFHAYPSYTGDQIDYDNDQGSAWDPYGGWTLGKARYLRDTMADYGVDKPLILDEIALGCPPEYPACNPITADYFEAQSNFLVRTFVRDLSEDIQVFIWYTLNGPGWRQTGLLNGEDERRPPYIAYRELATRLQGSEYQAPVSSYGAEVEAYEFATGANRIHVLWSIDTTADYLWVPQSEYVAAYDRVGNLLVPEPDGDDYKLSVGFSPIYIVLLR